MGILTTSHNSKRQTELFQFTQGIDVDSRLAEQEISVQLAWARGLMKIKALSESEMQQIEVAFSEASELMKLGRFDWRAEDEDVHMNLERFVTEKAGILGKKMHSGRSRNDLIATTLRLFVRDSLAEILEQLNDLGAALIERALKDQDVLVPGLTHVQNGQPVRHGHVLAAHAWAFARDLRRIKNASETAMATMPLGSAALSGTTLAIDLSAIAQELGFASSSMNSYDAVGDRDFMVEAIDALASLGVHLSRISEDFIIWASSAFSLVKLPPDWSTGSSIMPNKRNPDVPELIRGKSSHLIACATNAHTLLKSMPTSYGSDLHELKSVLIRSFDQAQACLAVLPQFVRGLEVDRKRACEMLKKGHILATEIADELAKEGVPFREAYKQVAELVKKAEESGCQVHELPGSVWKTVSPELNEPFMSSLSFESAIERRKQPGGTSLQSFQTGIAALKEHFKK
jgi:argininosuccinate lyase